MNLLCTYQKIENYPFGKSFMSFMVCLKIPYFFSIKPFIVELEEGRAVVQMKERRSVHNHLKTVHAIAMCNLCEFAMAVVTESTIPKNLKFIPVGMSVEYKRKAKGTLRGITQIRKEDFKVGDVGIPVDVFDENNINVISAVITLNIKEKSA
jgi:acyl-coenzyme A thioesterase PaaI-like protein